MANLFVKILSVILIIGIICCVGLAAAALIYNEVLIIYQCAIVSSHLLLITILVHEMVDLETTPKNKNKGDNE